MSASIHERLAKLEERVDALADYGRKIKEQAETGSEGPSQTDAKTPSRPVSAPSSREEDHGQMDTLGYYIGAHHPKRSTAPLLVDVKGAASELHAYDAGLQQGLPISPAAAREIIRRHQRPIDREAMQTAFDKWMHSNEDGREMADVALAELARQMNTGKPAPVVWKGNTSARDTLSGSTTAQGEGIDSATRTSGPTDAPQASATTTTYPFPMKGSSTYEAPTTTTREARKYYSEHRLEALIRAWFGIELPRALTILPSDVEAARRVHDCAERMFLEPRVAPAYVIGWDKGGSGSEACFNVYRNDPDGSTTLLSERFGETIEDAIHAIEYSQSHTHVLVEREELEKIDHWHSKFVAEKQMRKDADEYREAAIKERDALQAKLDAAAKVTVKMPRSFAESELGGVGEVEFNRALGLVYDMNQGVKFEVKL